MDTLSVNHEKLRVFCGYLHSQVVEQNTVIKDLTSKMNDLIKKVDQLENNVTLAQLQISTDDQQPHSESSNTDNLSEETELRLLD